MLGHLEERRQGREQVGEDLLADRHEGAAPGQLAERLERGHAHADASCAVPSRDGGPSRAARASRAAPRNSPVEGRVPQPPLELPHRLGREHVEAAEGPAPRRLGVAQQPRPLGVVDEVVDGAPPRQRRRRHGGVVDVGRGADRRGVHQQVPGAGRRWERDRRAAREGGDLRRALGTAGAHRHRAARVGQPHRRRPRRAAGPEHAAAEPADAAPRLERREEAGHVGVQPPPPVVVGAQGVDGAGPPAHRVDVDDMVQNRLLERRGDAEPLHAEDLREGHEVFRVRGLEGNVDGVDSGLGEARVVHDRRQRV